MKSLAESPAVLSVHEGTRGQYIVRVTDLKHRNLVVGVTKLLEDAESFVVITPSDIKVFNANGESNGQSNETQIPQDQGDEIQVQEQEEVPEVKVVRRPGRPRKEQAGHDETCQRCKGEGQIQILLEGGSPASSPCPICKGEGVMRRYGARR